MPIRSTASSPYIRRAVVYHATMITILWVLVLFLSLGFGISMLQSNVRLSMLEQQNAVQALRIEELSNVPPQAIETPTTTSMATSTSEETTYGILNRGSLSADGSKYAGYDDTTVGKKGIGVQVIGETRVRHIVIFNTKTELSGNGTPSDAGMSVRWKDASTFEYDVLVVKGGTTVKETRESTIYF